MYSVAANSNQFEEPAGLRNSKSLPGAGGRKLTWQLFHHEAYTEEFCKLADLRVNYLGGYVYHDL